MKTTLREMLQSREWLLADGAMGTNLFSLGLETGHPPEMWNVEHPEKIMALHQSFIEAGVDILLTNSFGGTSFRLKLHKSSHRVTELNMAAAKLAREVADHAKKPVLVAGSIGPTGELFMPLGSLTDEDAEAAFTAQAKALAAGGADLLWIETMSSLEEVGAAAKGAMKTGLPVFATMTFDTAGHSMMGIKPADYAEFANAIPLDGFGANCGIGPAELLDSIKKLSPTRQAASVIAKGNCGIPAYVDGEIHYHGTPDLMADYACIARDLGVQIIGGCCGTTPDHIRAMYQALHQNPKALPPSDADIEARLGKAWKDIPEQGTTRAVRERRRR